MDQVWDIYRGTEFRPGLQSRPLLLLPHSPLNVRQNQADEERHRCSGEKKFLSPHTYILSLVITTDHVEHTVYLQFNSPTQNVPKALFVTKAQTLPGVLKL